MYIVQIKKHPSKILLRGGLSQAAYLQNTQLQSNVNWGPNSYAKIQVVSPPPILQ